MRTKPIFPIGIMLLIFIAFFLVSAYLIIKNKTKTHEKIFSLVRVTAIYVLVLIIGIRPVMVETKYEFATKNLDVLFILDNTISMRALDYNGRKPRMDGAKNDVNYILSELAGSNFGLVTFDDSAHVLSPFTQDMQYIRDLLDTEEPPDSYYARGSDPSIAYQDIEALLLSSAKKENRKTIVFFLGDGEVTGDRELKDFSDLGQYVDAGAVLGYGTTTGGKMKNSYGYGYVYDYNRFQDAVSKIDEENLKKMARELGVDYLYLNGGNAALQGLVDIIKESSKTVIESGNGAEIESDVYYYLAIPLAILLFMEIFVFLKNGRL
ncbi:MAG: VWA domain-containing protein [Butyrivibrio sp.]|nr:VWA domain-containing protein [Butyrivibrio sp.]